jgi:hypothetical protein
MYGRRIIDDQAVLMGFHWQGLYVSNSYSEMGIMGVEENGWSCC